ncbi:MAG: hypothetical protein JWR33_1797 [Naasia sp.]|uniref:RDD family protein n=1 Tax=Naasia sp. TaxID=2546198 RepID=UPI00262D0C11|nr:RDD family protein [Naasia sp.]MCU1571056.1 hypothetical protein [Naasia sp.]
MPDVPASPAGRWPGDRLGLPEGGRGSIARPGRRIAAIAVDSILCGIVYALFFYGSSWASLALFVAEQIVLLAAFGAGIGHLALGLRVVPLHGGRLGLWRPVVRTALLALLVPAVIWDADQRGLHDVFSGTVLLRA